MKDSLYNAIFRVSDALEIPVIIIALLALAFVVLELGRFATELNSRRQRRTSAPGIAALDLAVTDARAALGENDDAAAVRALRAVSWSAAMDATYAAIIEHVARSDADARVSKDLADFDFGRQRRLGHTRLLVRVGPALGLMGTLIPLSPALDALARGNVATLTQNLRVAFSITVLGLLVGAVAFGLSLVRDRLYGQDYSDLEYVAAMLTRESAST